MHQHLRHASREDGRQSRAGGREVAHVKDQRLGRISFADEGSRQALESQRAVTEAGETIRLLGETMGEASQAAAQIAASAGQQSTGMAQIRQAMRNIREVTQQNLVATQQTERAAKDLSLIGGTLVELVGGRNPREG